MTGLGERIGKLLLFKDAAAAYDPNVQAELRSIYLELGKPITRPNCQDCLYRAMNDLRKLDLTLMKKTVAKLKTGEYLRAFGDSESYDNTNLTDAIARRLLAEYPGMASSFKTLPPSEPVEGDEDYVAPKAEKTGKTEKKDHDTSKDAK